jgi:hypothetical protein
MDPRVEPAGDGKGKRFPLIENRSSPAASADHDNDGRRSAAVFAPQGEVGGGSCGIGAAAALGAADWLCLAAAPTFAIMALLTGAAGGGRMAAMCSPLGDAWPVGGMVPMYLLMSAFHSPPWLKLISSRSGGARRR